MAIDQTKLNDLMGRAVADIGAAMSAPLVLVGERLGLYRGLAAGGPQTSSELAARTGTTERYVREWLRSQAAGGYVTYDAATDRYALTEEQALALADESSPAYLPGAFAIAAAAAAARPRIEDAFRTGRGLGWHEHDPLLFEGTEKFFRPGYVANLVGSWIPALDGVEDRLRRGARVADVGCGHGASTLIMARAFPRSTFVGFDYHSASIQAARRRAAEAGLRNVTFEVARAQDFPGTDWDLVAFFDCLHDMGDPTSAAAHVRKALTADGTWMLVEPQAGDRVEQNLNPVGRVYYSASTMICVPASLSQEVGAALGAQAGESRLRDVITLAGFTTLRRATETPFNIVFEAKP